MPWHAFGPTGCNPTGCSQTLESDSTAALFFKANRMDTTVLTAWGSFAHSRDFVGSILRYGFPFIYLSFNPHPKPG